MIGRGPRKRATALVSVLALIGGLVGAIVVEGPAYAAKVPGPPTSVTAVAGPGVGVVSLTWANPSNLGANAVINYYISTAKDGGAFGGLASVGRLKKATMPCTGIVSCSFRVYANTAGGGTGAPSPAVTAPWKVPTPPMPLNGSGGPNVGSMTVSWSAPVSTGGKAVTAYLYDVQVNSTGAWLGPFAIAGLPNSGWLPCSSTLPTGGCNYRLYARNAVGTSPASAPLAPTWGIPSAPVINSVTPGRPAHAATINWHPGTSTGGLANTYTYEVAMDGGPFVAGPGPIPASPTVATVECNATTICSYRLKATSAAGTSAYSNTLSTGFNAPSMARTVTARVSALNLGSGTPTVSVTWAPPANLGGTPITAYEARRCDGNCDESSSAWASAPTETLGTSGTWSTTCPAGLITCSYEVRAINVIGPGPWGSSARITPFAPTNVIAATAPPAGSVGVAWTGPAEVGQGIDHFTLYYCVTSTGCMSSAHWQDTGLTIPGTAQSAVHNCGINVQCTYKVAAVERNSGASGAGSSSAAATGSVPADAPQNLTANSGTSIGAVDLAWNAPSNSGTFPVTDYVFERSVNSGPFSAPISTGSTGTSYTDTGCGGGNFCTYQVAAVTLAGTGAFSNTATAEGANVPSVPLNLAATPGGTFGSVDLTWQAPLDNGGWPVTGYFLERSLDGGATWPQSWTLGTSPSSTDITCGNGVTCTYRVSAINARGTGPASNTATAVGTNLSPPLNLTATTSTTTLGGVLLAWDPPASDSGFPIQGYEFRYKVGAGTFGAWVDTGTLTGPRTFTHACGQDNTCTYEVRAYNAIGTSGPSNDASALGLTDHTAPILTVTTPASGSTLTTATPTISGTAGNSLGDSAIVSVTVKQGTSVIRTFTVTRTGTAWTVGAADWAAGSPTSLPDGSYTVTASQVDWASNVGTSAPPTSFTIDANAPSIAVTKPIAGLYASAGTTYGLEASWLVGCTSVGMCGTAGDGTGTGVSTVRVSVRQGTGNYWTGTGTNFTSGSEVLLTPTGTTSWNLAFGTANFPAGGQYTVRAVASDGVGFQTSVSVTFYVDYVTTDAVFVSTTGSDGANTGLTPASPVATIAKGVQVAQANSRSRVVVSGGTYGATTIQGAGFGNKTITGGYTPTTFLRSTPGTNTVTISAGGTAMLVDNYTESLQQLTISGTATGVTAPASVYGLRAINNAAVTLERSSVSAATAPNGAPGTDASGNAGTATNGGTGAGPAGNGNSNRTGGTAGSGVGGRNGGTGGTGGAQGNNPGGGGANGVVSGAGGGNGGSGGGGTSDTFCDSDAGAGGGGLGGSAGGASPAGGAAGTIAPLASDADTFPSGTAPTGGTAGTTANDGHGGGGGGGGGGESNTFCTNDHGAGGGGGGGGGGRGNPGGAGTNGGSSFAIYARNASITIDASSSATSGNGGAGGKGGNGSAGALGAIAGKGGQCDSGQEGGGGGTGGGGGGGTGGTGGGGGSGGHSVALYHKGTGTLTVTGTSVKGSVGAAGGTGTGGGGGGGGAAQTSSGTTGSGGCNPGAAGGTGGTGPAGNAGAAGAAGTAFRIWDNGTTTL